MAIPRPDTRRQPPKLPPQMRPFDDLEDLAASRMPAKPSTDRAPVSGMPAPKAVESTSDRREAARREADQLAQAVQGEAAGQGGGVQYTGGKKDEQDARDKYMEAGLAAKGDGLDDLARARQAAAQEIDAQNARAAMDQRSRAGLGGLGLSGAASASEGDLARTQARSKVLTMQQFDQAAEDAKFTDIQRQAALDDLEDAADIDYDGDGMVAGEPVGGTIGDGDPENDKKPKPPKPKPIPTNGDLNGDGVISVDERKAAQVRNKKESDLQDRAAGGLGAGVPMEGKANADGTVTNTSTKKTYSTATLEEALAGNWVYGGASFTADGKTYRVYTDSKGKKHAVEG